MPLVLATAALCGAACLTPALEDRTAACRVVCAPAIARCVATGHRTRPCRRFAYAVCRWFGPELCPTLWTPETGP